MRDKISAMISSFTWMYFIHNNSEIKKYLMYLIPSFIPHSVCLINEPGKHALIKPAHVLQKWSMFRSMIYFRLPNYGNGCHLVARGINVVFSCGCDDPARSLGSSCHPDWSVREKQRITPFTPSRHACKYGLHQFKESV